MSPQTAGNETNGKSACGQERVEAASSLPDACKAIQKHRSSTALVCRLQLPSHSGRPCCCCCHHCCRPRPFPGLCPSCYCPCCCPCYFPSRSLRFQGPAGQGLDVHDAEIVCHLGFRLQGEVQAEAGEAVQCRPVTPQPPSSATALARSQRLSVTLHASDDAANNGIAAASPTQPICPPLSFTLASASPPSASLSSRLSLRMDSGPRSPRMSVINRPLTGALPSSLSTPGKPPSRLPGSSRWRSSGRAETITVPCVWLKVHREQPSFLQGCSRSSSSSNSRQVPTMRQTSSAWRRTPRPAPAPPLHA